MNITQFFSNHMPDLSGLSNLIDPTQSLQATAITGIAIAVLGGAYLKFDKQEFLESAIEKDSPMRVRLALMVGADPSKTTDPVSRLQTAVLHERFKAAEVLVQHGASGISLSDNNFRQAIIHKGISPDILEFVLKHNKKAGNLSQQIIDQCFQEVGASRNFPDTTVKKMNIKKLDLLIKEGADTTQFTLSNENFRSEVFGTREGLKLFHRMLQVEKKAGRLDQEALDLYLHEICAKPDSRPSTLEKMTILIQKGANVNSPSPDKFKGNYADGPCLTKVFNHLPFSAAIQIIKLLLEKEADPNAPDAKGDRPLHFAFDYCISSPELVDLLLQSGAYPGFTNKKEQMPLHKIGSAKSYAFKDVLEIPKVRSIINHIRLISKPSNLMTPIHEREFGISAQRALTLPALIDAVDNKGQTPLHHALKYPSEQLVTLLLDAGAHILPDNKGVTPVDLAQNHPEILKIFQDRGLEPVKK